MPTTGNKLDDDVKKQENNSHQDMDGYEAKKKHSNKDPRVTISDSLIIDVDGILDNDDEVSLETPVTIPENPEPSEFGRAVTDALVPAAAKVSSESERSGGVRFSSGKDGINKSESAKVSSNIQKRKPPSVIKSKLKSTPKLDQLGKEGATSEVKNGSHSDNLSDSTASTTNKTSGGAVRTSSRASQKVLKDRKVPKRRGATRLNGDVVEKKIGKAKLPNGLNDVTDASANPSLEKANMRQNGEENGEKHSGEKHNGEKRSGEKHSGEKGEMRQNGEGSGDSRPPIQAPWDPEKAKKEEKPNSAKNKPKKIDIDELQKDMGKI